MVTLFIKKCLLFDLNYTILFLDKSDFMLGVDNLYFNAINDLLEQNMNKLTDIIAKKRCK